MVKRPALALDVALAALAVLLHPALSPRFKAILGGYALFCLIVPRPTYRFLFPLIGTAGFKGFAAIGFTAGSSMEADYFLFILCAVLWAVVPTGGAGRRDGSSPATVATIGFAAVSLGFLLLWVMDRIVPPLGPLLLLDLGRHSSRLHLAAVGAAAVASCLFLWRTMNARAHRGGKRLLVTLDGYLACRRELRSLGRKWSC